MRNTKPTADQDYIKLVDGDSINIDSEKWYELLSSELTSFRYDSYLGKFTARKEQRKGIDYWYGERRLFKKLRHIYIGKTEEVDKLALANTAARLSLSDEEFWKGEYKRKSLDEFEKSDISTSSKVKNLHTFDREKLSTIAKSLLNDANITRNGRDRGAVKRGVEAFIERLIVMNQLE